ncbi:MAG: hypothetical protein CVT49_03520 [candidate division Zixibacteria bacterium HGW-Zixibacteria-1]|nr:MAG: hypothetical protein CVT49_03520 [candidate division Zixibacteria bacterium HGW-Zixibacteria-1]
MSYRSVLVIVILAVMFLFPGLASAQNDIIVSLKSPACPWSDNELEEKVDMLLTSMNRATIIRRTLPTSTSAMSFEDMVLWGQQQGGRYLVDVTIDRIDLEQRKVTLIPWVIFRYRVYAVMEGTLRIIDLKKGRLIDLKHIECDVKASDKWQIVDDDKTDADLMVPADEKPLLFDELEERAAAWLYQEIKKLTRGNHLDG